MVLRTAATRVGAIAARFALGVATAAGCDPSAALERPTEQGLSQTPLGSSEDDDADADADADPDADRVDPENPAPREPSPVGRMPVGPAPPDGEVDPTPVADEPTVAPMPSAATPTSAAPRPAVAIRTPERPELVKHRVVTRETLHQIAARYDVLESAVRRWNGLGDDVVRPKPRSTLKIWARRIPPPRRRVEHTVVEGETWGTIARAYGVASTDLRAYNVRRVGRSLDPDEVVQLWIDPVVHDDILAQGPDEEVRRGAYGVGAPADGRLVNGVQIPEDPAWSLHFPSSAWGTTYAVSNLVAAIRAWRASSGYDGVLRIGSMSRQRGGEFGSHRSHQTGRDVDIRLPLLADTPQGIAVNVRRVDWWALWQLIDAMLATGSVDVVFFDYKLQRRLARAAEEHGVAPGVIADRLQWPIGSKAARGTVRHEPGHTEHIHVRFRCGPTETECAHR